MFRAACILFPQLPRCLVTLFHHFAVRNAFPIILNDVKDLSVKRFFADAQNDGIGFVTRCCIAARLQHGIRIQR